MSVTHANKLPRYALISVLLVSALAVSYVTEATAKERPYSESITAPAIVNYPSSIASTGDSITRAFNTGGVPFTDSTGNSWSTGTNSTVMSHYSRILPNHPPISGQNFNDAVTGAQMVDLNSQVQSAVTQGAAYVTVLLGANDACTDTEAQMTPVATYRAQFQTAMNTLATGLPNARIFVLSVPNVYNLWFILKDDSSARSTWSLFGICQSLLANPTSTAQADVDRRNRVKQRVIDYNTQLAEVCATNIHCKFDNNAAFNTDFVPSDVSTRDYFHPTIAGQAKIANVSYGATFDFREGVPPATVAMLGKSVYGGNRLFTFTASDNTGVAGIEYKINSGAWTRYASPVSLPNGSSLTYRAVDVNGNIETARTITPAASR
jgi:lysophospholipase L1-like esterase